MWSAWLLFLLMWIGYAWALTSPKSKVSTANPIQIHAPIFQQDCMAKPVACVDDCTFLCVETNTRCVGGRCEVQHQPEVPCQTDKGGMIILAQDPVPKWICLCTDATYWTGPDCGTLNPDVCENGMFLYKGRDNFICVCSAPYEKVMVNGKPHCLDAEWVNFFPDEKHPELVQEKIGPVWPFGYNT